MSLINELKRRNVFRVGVAYVVGAWLLLQITDVLQGLLNLPASIGPIVVAIVAIGFPITLFIAWAYELTPDGIKHESEVDRSQSISQTTGKKLNGGILVLLLIAVTYLLFDKFMFQAPYSDARNQQGMALDQSLSSGEQSTARPSIAVLPFDNRSNQQSDEYFVEGIHDDLLTNLAQIGSLKVISRTSVTRYKETLKSIPEIASELDVETVLEGAVQRSGETVRINVQLIRASTDEHLWAEIFDRQLTAENLFAIQSEISEKIAAALKTTLSPDELEAISGKPTENLEAYEAYLSGRQLLSRRNNEELKAAREQFERAIELDPQFAQAWSSRALAALLHANYGNFPGDEAEQIMEQASSKALELNPNLSEPWLIRAYLKESTNRKEEAEADYLKALELNPNSALAHHWYANLLDDSTARLEEALEHALKSTELDPLSSIDQLELADLYQKLGRLEEAERLILKVIDRDPDFAPSYEYMAWLKEENARYDEMLNWSRQAQQHNPSNMRLLLQEVRALAGMGDRQKLLLLRERIEEADPNSLMLGMVDAISSILNDNIPAAKESLNWMIQKAPYLPFLNEILGMLNVLEGNYTDARVAYERADARAWNPSSWRKAYEESTSKACNVVWIMLNTDDTERGQTLLREVLAYYEEELPGYVQKPERFDSTLCYIIDGQSDRALEIFTDRVNSGFIDGWWAWIHHPLVKTLSSEPQYQLAMEIMHKDLAAQRERSQ